MNSSQPGMFSSCLYSLSQQTNKPTNYNNNNKRRKVRPPSQGKLLALPVWNKPFLYHYNLILILTLCVCVSACMYAYVSVVTRKGRQALWTRIISSCESPDMGVGYWTWVRWKCSKHSQQLSLLLSSPWHLPFDLVGFVSTSDIVYIVLCLS